VNEIYVVIKLNTGEVVNTWLIPDKKKAVKFGKHLGEQATPDTEIIIERPSMVPDMDSVRIWTWKSEEKIA